MDITLQVMARPATHDLNNPEKEAKRYIKGDVIAVYKRSDCPEPPSPNSRMVFIHITDVPIVAIRKAKALMAAQFEDTPGTYIDGTAGRNFLKRRKWNIADADLPQSAINTLRDNREITVSWAIAKAYLKNKATQLYITEGDLDG